MKTSERRCFPLAAIFKSFLRYFLFAVFTTMVLGCNSNGGGESGSSGGNNGNSSITSAASGVVGSSGGTIEVTVPDSPIQGAKVVVPQNAVESDKPVTITIDYEDELPAPIESGTVSVSKVIVLTKDSKYKFILPVLVTIPYTDAQLEAGDIPAVFYWDPSYGKYVAVGIKDIDTTNKTITFTTIHFSKYLALGIKGLWKAPSSVDSGFQPGTDGFFHPNFGAYDFPGGSCLGMANYSEWYFANKKASDGQEGLYAKYRQGDVKRWEDDTTARELISRAVIASSQPMANFWSNVVGLGDGKTGLLLIEAMHITKSPQTFTIKSNFTGKGHAVTVYKYDAAAGKFYIYDNNYPNAEVTIDWNSNTGFSNFSKADVYPDLFSSTKKSPTFAFDAYSSLFTADEFEELYTGAKSGWPASKFQSINITAPSLDASNSAAVSDPNNVTVTGTVTGGLTNAQYLVYNVNGTDTLAGQLITLGADGTFSFTMPNLPQPSNSVMMMTTADKADAIRRTPNSYAGFKEVTVKVQGQALFTNFGFETGDYAGWVHETHTWFNTTPGSSTPEKSGIESIGFDPIDPSIQIPYLGNHAARINNYDNNYHISSVSQTATIPNVVTPELKFYWAAVLEDPQHNPADQPYVDILVRDETAGIDLYSKHFYSNDPGFSGWKTITGSSYGLGEWKAIPWQTVILDVSGAKGHQVTIKVTAADCALGGHGGYAYLDAGE